MSHSTHPSRPFLKWPGGKYRLLPILKQHLPAAPILVEPFVGAGAVFLNTSYSHAIINDINPHLMNVYHQLLEHQIDFIHEAKKWFIPKNNTKKVYYAARQTFNTSTDNFERAVLFIFLNRYGYNGLIRFNKRDEFNVPFGMYKQPYFPDNEMRLFLQKSPQLTCHNEHFAEIMQDAPANSVIYCDPPYHPLSKTAAFTSYSQHTFGEEEQQALAEIARRIACKKQRRVIISNHDTTMVRRWYKGAKIISFHVQRHISCQQRKKVKELIAIF